MSTQTLEWHVVRPSGPIDASTCGELRTTLDSLVQEGVLQLEVDLSDVTFIDSSGLGTLVGMFKTLRVGGGDLRLRGLTQTVKRVFQLTHLDRVFQILPADG